jgi:hypothetical protein
VTANGQDDAGVRRMVALSGSDTLEIQNFDDHGHKIFDKVFPSYGVSQILAWHYSGETLQSYTWSHSSIGFDESEYEWNRLKDTANVYSYKLDGQQAPKNLMGYYSIEALKKSKEFENYIRNGKRVLKSTQYFENGHLIKELKYSSTTRTDTIKYSYSDDLLTRRKEIYGHNGAYNEVIYEYDELGNETRWMKVFDSTDTSAIYSRTYENGLLKQVIAIERKSLASEENYQYKNGKLTSMKQVDSKGVEKVSAEYFYREDGRIDYVDEVNRYVGQAKRTWYFY